MFSKGGLGRAFDSAAKDISKSISYNPLVIVQIWYIYLITTVWRREEKRRGRREERRRGRRGEREREKERGGGFVEDCCYFKSPDGSPLCTKFHFCLFLILKALAATEPDITILGYATPPQESYEASMWGLLAREASV